MTDVGGGPIANVTVRAWNTNLSPAISRTTDTSGNYNIPVPAGTYRVQFDPGAHNYVIEYNNNKPDMKTADTVTVNRRGAHTRRMLN